MSVIPLPGKSVGLVGLGAMGGPIARNFVNSGQPLIVRDADAASQQRFLDSHPSAVGTTDFADFAKCDVVVLVLPTSDIVDAVVLGEGDYCRNCRQVAPSWTWGRAFRTALRSWLE